MFKEKDVISRIELESTDYEVNFSKYDDKDANRVKKYADMWFNLLYTNSTKSSNIPYSNSCVVESQIFRKVKYLVKYVGKGKDVLETTVVEVLKKPNPYFCDIFEKRLKDNAKEFNTYVSVKYQYDLEQEIYYILFTIYNEKQFENKYGISLDEYYIKDSNNVIVTREDKYRQEIKCLKEDYIKFMVDDVDKRLDSDFIEMDGYAGLLMINSDFKDIMDKNIILNEFGFVVDDDNKLLKLNKNVKSKKLSK